MRRGGGGGLAGAGERWLGANHPLPTVGRWLAGRGGGELRWRRGGGRGVGESTGENENGESVPGRERAASDVRPDADAGNARREAWCRCGQCAGCVRGVV